MAEDAFPATVINILKNVVDRSLPGRLEPDLPQILAASGPGFALRHGQVLSIIFVDQPQEYNSGWWLHIVSGIAIEVPNISAAISWANLRNKNSPIGAYHSSVIRGSDEQRTAIVMLHTSVSSQLLHVAYVERSDAISDWVTTCLRCTIEVASVDNRALMELHGGRSLDATQFDIADLYAASAPAGDYNLYGSS